MKNRYLIALITILLISNSSFKPLEVTKKSSLVKGYSMLYGKYIMKTNYEYDIKGRLVKESVNTYEVNKEGSIMQEVMAGRTPAFYTYFKDSVVMTVNNTWVRMILNKKKLFIKNITPNEFSKTNKLTTREKQTYDSNGFVIKKEVFDDYVTYSFSMVYDYEYSNGNILKETRTSQNKSSDGTNTENSYYIEYEYYEDKLNTLGNVNFGKNYLGNSNKNLVKREKKSNGYNIKYEYEFDKNGNITTMNVLDEKSGIKAKEYHYEYY